MEWIFLESKEHLTTAPSGCKDGLLRDELGGHVATNDLSNETKLAA